MSKILPKTMPAKNLSGDIKERMPQLLQETCIAEFAHGVLCFTGLYCLKLYPGIGGLIITLLYNTFLNMPFILIRRYNRPRLARVAKKMQQIEEASVKRVQKRRASADFESQYR